MQISAELYEFVIKVVDDRVREIKVTREDFNALKQVVEELAQAQEKTEQRLGRVEAAVEQLAQAQKKTEQRVEELAQAQKKTEQRLGRVEAAVEQLAQAQKKTEQRVEELAQAQKKTEQRVEELAQAQKKTEQRLGRVEAAVEQLSQAQKRTEEELCSLIREHAKTREMVAGLSDTVGYGLENQAYKSLPRLLERDFDLKVKGKLARRYIIYEDGKEDEVNVYGWGMKDGKKILILGESEVKLSRKKLTRFLKRAERIKHYEGAKESLLLAITHMTHPKIEEYASQNGIKVYYSYEF